MKNLLKKELPFFMAVPAVLWQILFLYVPLLFVIGASFSKNWDGTFFNNITFEHYTTFFDATYFRIIFRSLILAFTNAFLCLLLAYPLAYFVAVKVQKWKNVLLFFLVLPFWTSLLVQVYAWFVLLERNGLINSILVKFGLITEPLVLLNTVPAIYCVMLCCYLPFMVMPIYSVLEKLDKQLIDVSFDLGANQWITLRRVIVPLSMSGIKTGFFLVFIPSFGEFVIPALLGGDKQMYVGSLISHYFLVANNPFLGSAFTVVSGLVLVALSTLFYVYFKRSVRLIHEGQ